MLLKSKLLVPNELYPLIEVTKLLRVISRSDHSVGVSPR